MTLKTQESRVGALIRLSGIFVFILGSAMAYLTYSEAGQGNLAPQIVPVFYLVAALLLMVGFVAIIARLK
ncbi:MAG: hypothetical protein OK422_04245 [Thaumarchaeota archaeon]|nr:hypothetical protein [Nitrososphaerota archaeon]